MELWNAIVNCLKKAEKIKARCIAIPAVSSGKFHFPKEDCAETMFRAVEFYAKNMNRSLEEVRFVNVDITTFVTFKLMFVERYMKDETIEAKLKMIANYQDYVKT